VSDAREEGAVSDADSDRSAPEGATCGEHPERPAYFTCPRCGAHACVFCWHPAVDRCSACLTRDPTEAAPPIPWEEASTGGVGAYLRTLGAAFRPVRTAPAFARDELAPALRFLWLSAVPMALLAGIIPHTRTLEFGDVFGVELLKNPDSATIALDVARAMAVQAGLFAVELAAIALPFTSLVRAYAHPTRRAAALRVVLYRVWLVPGTALLFYLGGWALPAPSQSDVIPAGYALLLALRVILPVYLMVAMGATARLACGLGPGMSIVVVLVPFILSAVVDAIAVTAVEAMLPALPAAGG